MMGKTNLQQIRLNFTFPVSEPVKPAKVKTKLSTWDHDSDSDEQ